MVPMFRDLNGSRRIQVSWPRDYWVFGESLLARIVILCQFLILIAGFLAIEMFSMFLGNATSFGLAVFGPPILLVSALVVLSYAIWRPSWRKTALCIGTVVFGVALLFTTPSISRAGRWLFFASRQTRLD